MFTLRYDYQELSRETRNGTRHYVTPSGEKLASVTTILDKTKSEESKKALMEWKKRVGTEEAQRITTAAAARGTKMHTFLEHYVLADNLLDPGNDNNQIHSHKMAEVIVKNAFHNINEIWGSEVSLYYPQLYAGSTDLVGVWKGKPAIIDFKQSNKSKRKEWISDYFCQLSAYSQAHDELYKTKIETGVVLMCTQDLEYQEFVIEGDEFRHWSNEWWKRVERYYMD